MSPHTLWDGLGREVPPSCVYTTIGTLCLKCGELESAGEVVGSINAKVPGTRWQALAKDAAALQQSILLLAYMEWWPAALARVNRRVTGESERQFIGGARVACDR